YSPEATGKVEKFNRLVDSFLAEAALEKPQTLERSIEWQRWQNYGFNGALYSYFFTELNRIWFFSGCAFQLPFSVAW
ncbi:MAG: hypothetical protein PHW19_11695, partial [Salinivirgaceae bacterium]|nr:hypothetical protein [Salinivirgaceae bacterium]